jgi:glycosyltransferase involved in cell wall biosynthesis
LPIVRRRYPDVKLTVVGRGHAADLRRLNQTGVQVTGEVPDIRPYILRAAVVAVPIRIGGGTRLKVVEGLALAKPMVSTTVGCEGLNVRDGEHLAIADGADAFASSVVRAFDEPSWAEALGRAGRALMEKEYSWESAGDRLDELYRRIAARDAGLAGAGRAVGQRLSSSPREP